MVVVIAVYIVTFCHNRIKINRKNNLVSVVVVVIIVIIALPDRRVLHYYGAGEDVIDGAVVMEGDEGEADWEEKHQQKVLHH